MKKTFFLFLAAVLMLMGCATQQERAEQRLQVSKAVAEAVAKRRLHIDIMSMNTMRYGSRMVTPDFFLELQGDTLQSYLPYLGQVYQAPMASPSKGLNFKANIRSFKQSQPKPHLSRLEIEVRTEEDSYHYIIEVFDTGKASIHVRSQHRDPISFDGDIATP
jgi:hypothetical protein